MNNSHSSRRATTLRVMPTVPLETKGFVKLKRSDAVRYGVVGLGHIAQTAVLPAFKHAQQNSRLVALFSDDAMKRLELGRRYHVPHVVGYQDYEAFLEEGRLDAVYIALPNSMHCDFVIRAARAGVHILCEKPLGLSERECRVMIAVCKRNQVKLMTAYRLHFEKANLEAMNLSQSGRIGELRYFNSIFSMQARAPNIRLDQDMGGGPLWDLGVYCINAARNLFREEPVEVMGVTATGRDKRFQEVEEMVSATLLFPGERLASFICSFGAADAAVYEVVGTKGRVSIEHAYEYAQRIEMDTTIGERKAVRSFKLRDQFAPELLYFSDCILRNREPEPSGLEGLADVRIVEAIYKSAKTKKPARLARLLKSTRPSLRQEVSLAPVRKPELVHAKGGIT